MLADAFKTIMLVKGQDVTAGRFHMLNGLEELGYEYEYYADMSVINGLKDRFYFCFYLSFFLFII